MDDHPLDLTLYADVDELTATVTSEIIELVLEGINIKQRFDLALTGGSLGLKISKHMIKTLNEKLDSFQGLHIWWSDERYVPADSTEQNSLEFRNALKNENVSAHYVLASEAGSAQIASETYESELNEIVLDLVILGLGPDGHVASIFPGDIHLADLRKVFLIEDSPKPPNVRISFTMRTINSSNEVWIVAAGESKANAVSKLLEGDLSIPASYICARQRTRLIADTEAFFSE